MADEQKREQEPLADEHDRHEEDVLAPDGESGEEEPEGSGEQTTAPDEADVGASGPDEDDWSDTGDMIRDVNRTAIGELVLHYASGRDVSVVLDGDAALRALDSIRTRRTDQGDTLSVRSSSARNIWFVYWPTEVLAATWLPGLPRAREGMAIDPPARPGRVLEPNGVGHAS